MVNSLCMVKIYTAMERGERKTERKERLGGGVRGGENTVMVGGTGGKRLFKHKFLSYSSQGATA